MPLAVGVYEHEAQGCCAVCGSVTDVEIGMLLIGSGNQQVVCDECAMHATRVANRLLRGQVVAAMVANLGDDQL